LSGGGGAQGWRSARDATHSKTSSYPSHHTNNRKTPPHNTPNKQQHQTPPTPNTQHIHSRPGAREFIAALGQHYELVVYTDEQPLYADPIVNALDPGRAVQYRLYRSDTQYADGRHVRDLSKLNRDLGHVLFVSGA
jgi:TFIIF-interacting CTD phosphatase-like protein